MNSPNSIFTHAFLTRQLIIKPLLFTGGIPILSLCKNRYVILKLSKLTNRVVKYEYGCKCGNWRRGAHGHLTTPLSGAKNCNRM